MLSLVPVSPVSVSPGSGVPASASRSFTRCRTLLTLVLVVIVLATAGWTTVQPESGQPTPRAAALEAWRHGEIGGRPLPDPDAPPRAITHFFSALDRSERQHLADAYPLVVGNLDGAPPKLRYQANRSSLSDARDVERRRMTDPRLTDAGQDAAERRLHRFSSLLAPGRKILAFDPTGPGRAAEVFGDLGRAERVSVVVPGVGTELLTFEKSRRAHSAPVGMAKALYRQQRAASPEVRTAVVAWADYTAPEGLTMEAVTGESAEEGSTHLTSFLDGLPGNAPVALFCHSYGSVVCGVAANEHPARVTDIAVAGSPGMRVDSVAALNAPTRVWAMRSEDDWIARVPHFRLGGLGHGPDPMSPDFGARRLGTDGASGHEEYFAPGTGSLANLAEIGVGEFGAVSCAPVDPHCGANAG